eukprot:SAG25_NODE_1639_length_2639_cov_2.230315_5_plen_73_part_00
MMMMSSPGVASSQVCELLSELFGSAGGLEADALASFVAGGHVGESKRLVVESPWPQFTSGCPRFGCPPRLDK